MKHEFLEELGLLAQHIQPQQNGFLFRGTQYTADVATAVPGSTPGVTLLTNVLYKECYAKKKKHQYAYPTILSAAEPADAHPHFVDALSAANQSTAMSDPGWTVSNVMPGRHVQVTKYGVTRTMYVPAGPVPTINDTVSYVSAREERGIQQGFYYVRSNAIFEYLPAMLRVYWNIEPEGVSTLIHELTARFNYYQVPFLFKCLSNPAWYSRRDGCVLYIRYQYLQQVQSLLQGINQTIDSYLGDDVPLFTHRLHKGVGIAESPADGNSFGMSRMQMVASGLYTAFLAGKEDSSARIDHIDSAFINAGINPETPFLEAGSPLHLFINN